MTTSSEIFKNGPYYGNGATTVYDYEFKIFDKSHIRVVYVPADGSEMDLVLDTDYTVSGVGDDEGGSITLSSPLGIGESVTLIPSAPYTQNVIDLSTQGPFSSETIERAFDYLVGLINQVREPIDRAIKGAVSDNASLTLPTSRENKLASFDSSGNLVAVFDDPTIVSSLLDIERNTSAIGQVGAGKPLDFSTDFGVTDAGDRIQVTMTTDPSSLTPNSRAINTPAAGGLAGGGDLGADLSLSLDINGLGALALADFDTINDKLVVLDASLGVPLTITPDVVHASGIFRQTKSATKTDTFTTAVTLPTFEDLTGLSVTMTPKSATSKFRISFSVSAAHSSASGVMIALLVDRDGTPVGVADAAGSRTPVTAAVGHPSNGNAVCISGIVVDAPATASAVTYKLRISVGSGTALVNRGLTDTDVSTTPRMISTIVVDEIVEA